MFALCLSHLQKCNYNILNVSEHDYIAYNCSSNIAKKNEKHGSTVIYNDFYGNTLGFKMIASDMERRVGRGR